MRLRARLIVLAVSAGLLAPLAPLEAKPRKHTYKQTAAQKKAAKAGRKAAKKARAAQRKAAKRRSRTT